MNYKYITALLTEDFLPGVLVLNQSLKNVKSKHRLLVLITSNISNVINKLLKDAGIETQLIDEIKNPNLSNQLRNKSYVHLYSKLNVFNLIEFDKIVFLDADTFICSNVDTLFDSPHMSAVNAGGMLPKFIGWTKLNSGVLVLKPSRVLFKDFLLKKGFLPSEGGGDQGFLQSYYREWPNQKELHLCHGYNMNISHIQTYRLLFGFDFNNKTEEKESKTIKILHFWGGKKPWFFSKLEMLTDDELLAFEMWYKAAYQVIGGLSSDSIGKLISRFPNLQEFISNGLKKR